MGMKLAENAEEEKTLSQEWFEIEGMDERGAGGRLVIAPAALTRADLAFNYEIVGAAISIEVPAPLWTA